MNLDVVNNKYAFLFKDLEDYVPVKHDFSGSYTLNPRNADAFIINPISGNTKGPNIGELNYDKEVYSSVLIRAVIGHQGMSRVETNFTLGCITISNLINEMLFQAWRMKKDNQDKFKLCTFERPGTSNLFFTEIPYVGYELRLYFEL